MPEQFDFAGTDVQEEAPEMLHLRFLADFASHLP
jgi:hypothetical protein